MNRRVSRAHPGRSASDPISPLEFASELLKIWHPLKAEGQSTQRTKIGLCISGGSDSMALAYLFQQLKNRGLGPGFDLTALIIDHSHRSDSQQEASTVSSWLKHLGMKSRVQRLQWPPGQEPAKLTNFESLARRLRYRQLAAACIEEDIRALFLGHHLFDQVETTILRLMRGRAVASPGLRGMKPVNKIPCCEDIYGASSGIHASALSNLVGTRFTPPSTTQEARKRPESSAAITNPSAPFPARILVSHSGIKVYRPFLSFPKSRLIATCEVNGIPFVTDASNFDCKTTKRNAVRWLLSNDKMPVALRQESILRLCAASQRLSEARAKNLIDLLNATVLFRFDLRSGQLVVLVPGNIGDVCDASEQDAAYYIDRLLDLVSPGRMSKDHRIPIARRVFPELLGRVPSPPDGALDQRSLTSRGVLMDRLPGSSGRLWAMTRQPFRADEDREMAFTSASLHSHRIDRNWSNWTLWDGRYWVRIRTNNSEDVTQYRVRALRPSDMEELNGRRCSFSKELQYMLRTLLRDAAPAKIRYTLPVLVRGEELLVLLTLDVRIPSKYNSPELGTCQDVTGDLRWEVQYKDVIDTLQHLKKPDNDVAGALPWSDQLHAV